MLAGRRLKMPTIFSLRVIDIIYNAMKCSKLCRKYPISIVESFFVVMKHSYIFSRAKIHRVNQKVFIRFTASAFRKLPSISVFSYFPFGFEGRMRDLIVSVPDHCLSFYFK